MSYLNCPSFGLTVVMTRPDDVVGASEGKEVKNTGDGLMVAFASGRDRCMGTDV